MTKLGKALLFLSLIVVYGLTCFLSVSATEVRVGTMGGVGFYMHDNSNIFFFPGAIYTYSGQVVGELRVKNTDNTYSIGIHYPIADYSVVGVYLNRPAILAVKPNIVNTVALNHTTDFFYGMQMSQYDLGFRLSLGLDSYNQDYGATELKENARYLALAGGISNEKMDLGAFVELPSAKHDSAATINKWSGFGFGIAGRMFRGQATKLVPLVLLNYRTTTSKFEPGTAKTDYADMNLGLGLGVNHELNENNLLVMAVEILGMQSSKETRKNYGGGNGEVTNTRTTLPGLYIGVESKIKHWLTGRLGAAQVYQSITLKDKPEGGTEAKSTTQSSDFNVSFGLGFNFGDFTLDAAVNEGLFFDGPNFISGTTEPMARRLAITYKF
jgi:hypothetical protein